MATKNKTNSSAKKRFKRRGNGTLKCRRAFRNHILTKKAQKMKRQARAMGVVKDCDQPAIDRLLCEE